MIFTEFFAFIVISADTIGMLFDSSALFTVSSVLSVASQGFDHRDGSLVLSILSVDWEELAAPGGRLTITLAGDGAIAVDAECIDLTLMDVTRHYYAPSRQAPHHPD